MTFLGPILNETALRIFLYVDRVQSPKYVQKGMVENPFDVFY